MQEALKPLEARMEGLKEKMEKLHGDEVQDVGKDVRPLVSKFDKIGFISLVQGGPPRSKEMNPVFAKKTQETQNEITRCA